MYEEFFGFNHRPFAATPRAADFVPLEGPQGALDALAICCERGQGIGVLTADPGLGKTLIGLRLAFELQPTFATVFLGHSAFPTRRAFLQAILFELQRPYARMAEQELRLELIAALKALRPEHQALVVILDEAHRLSKSVLDEVRLLAMLADADEPLARVVLVGNRELEERLADPMLVEFNQRICCQVDLAPLTQAESIEYLRGCIEVAGASPEAVFTDDAITLIAKAADGVPRCLNHLADHSLLLAYATERRPVEPDIVREALDDLKQLPLQWHDPVSGGEIYRGRMQPPTMEDSAVELWPQSKFASEATQPSENGPLSDFGESSAAIEIGADSESDVAASCGMTCLRDDWNFASQHLSADASDSAHDTTLEQGQQSHEPQELSVEDTLSGHPQLGKIFESHDLEFGAPSPHSFAVDEFVKPHEDDAFDDVRFVGTSQGDSAECDDRAFDRDESSSPVWNLPSHAWESENDFDFEEEPVIDRYVRIESGTGNEGIAWNFNKPHGHLARKCAPAVTAQQTDDSSTGERVPVEGEGETSTRFSGIVESYSRSSALRGGERSEPDSPATTVPTNPHHDRRPDWHLPSELLRATLEDDGIEEQIGAEVLDLYLDTQQMLLEKLDQSQSPKASVELPAETDIDFKLESDELPDDDLKYDVIQPETIDHDVVADAPRLSEFSPADFEDFSKSRAARTQPESPARSLPQPDAIQRAYGRLFSELRRRQR